MTTSAAPAASLDALRLQPRFAALGEAYFSRVTPAPLREPRLLHFNEAAAALIDLDPAAARQPEFTAVMAGNRLLAGGDYLAMLYAGHQFGAWVPQLGDGRAILLGQVRNHRGESWDLQLKGAGKTPYSRFGDGRAVLRSSVREYLCGEAMHHLGIPTTRALCIVMSPEPVQRETIEPAAVLCRMAPSHVRFGNFEVFYDRGQFERLGPLADHVIDEHFPQLAGAPDRHLQWLEAITRRTAQLMAQWQAVGFCHGVMNTDNFSAIGITLDYGPYGFLDAFDASHVCNHSDEGGRYAYDQQPGIGHWNVSRLLQATLPLLHADADRAVEEAQRILALYAPAYAEAVQARWFAKLGLRAEAATAEGDAALVNRLLTLMHRSRADFTRTFRMLSGVSTAANAPAPALRDHVLDVAALDAWLADYRARLRAESSDDGERAARMDAVNPKVVLRNHLAQAAIERAHAGDAGGIDQLLRVLRAPFDERPEHDAWAAPPPPEAAHIAVSCSS